MGTFLIFQYVFSFLFGIIALVGSFILFKKTKLLSTLFIFISFFIGTIVLALGAVAQASSIIRHYFEYINLVSYLASPMMAIGLLIYAIKLNSKDIVSSNWI